MQVTDPTGLGMAFGPDDEGMAWVGRRVERRAEVAVNEAMIGTYCALVEDANPDYWEGGVAPPGLLMTWLMPLPWRPGGRHPSTSLFALEVPLPGHHIINVSTDTELSGALRIGDHVEATEEVVEVSAAKRTRLGEGHFITTVAEFRAGGRPVARNTNLLYRYDTDAGAASSATDPDLEARLARPTAPIATAPARATVPPRPVVGDELPSISLDVSLQRVVLNAAATWDWFPGHHNPFYARSQGQRTIYLSTLFFHGFVDRLVTDWAGPGAFITRRKITMRQSIFAGETATARGRVAGVGEQDGSCQVDIEASVDGPGGPCVPAEITVRVAPRPDPPGPA